MPGDIYLSDYDYSSGYGYAPTGQMQSQVLGGGGGGGSSSHTSFVIWLLVFTVGSVMILHGLKVANFTFVFKR